MTKISRPLCNTVQKEVCKPSCRPVYWCRKCSIGTIGSTDITDYSAVATIITVQDNYISTGVDNTPSTGNDGFHSSSGNSFPSSSGNSFPSSSSNSYPSSSGNSLPSSSGNSFPSSSSNSFPSSSGNSFPSSSSNSFPSSSSNSFPSSSGNSYPSSSGNSFPNSRGSSYPSSSSSSYPSSSGSSYTSSSGSSYPSPGRFQGISGPSGDQEQEAVSAPNGEQSSFIPEAISSEQYSSPSNDLVGTLSGFSPSFNTTPGQGSSIPSSLPSSQSYSSPIDDTPSSQSYSSPIDDTPFSQSYSNLSEDTLRFSSSGDYSSPNGDTPSLVTSQRYSIPRDNPPVSGDSNLYSGDTQGRSSSQSYGAAFIVEEILSLPVSSNTAPDADAVISNFLERGEITRDNSLASQPPPVASDQLLPASYQKATSLSSSPPFNFQIDWQPFLPEGIPFPSFAGIPELLANDRSLLAAGGLKVPKTDVNPPLPPTANSPPPAAQSPKIKTEKFASLASYRPSDQPSSTEQYSLFNYSSWNTGHQAEDFEPTDDKELSSYSANLARSSSSSLLRPSPIIVVAVASPPDSYRDEEQEDIRLLASSSLSASALRSASVLAPTLPRRGQVEDINNFIPESQVGR